MSRTPSYKTLIESHAQYFEDTGRIHSAGPVLAYVTPWNSAGYDNAVLFREKFTHVSPVWYQIRKSADGSFILAGGHDADRGWLERLRNHEGVSRVPKVVPRVIFELSPMDLALLVVGIDESGRRVRDPSTQEVFKLLRSELESFGYGGYVVEGWSAWASSGLLRNDFFRREIVKMLKEMRTAVGGEVIIAVSPPLRFSSSSSAFKPSPLFTTRDYQELKPVVDAFSLMTYDASNAAEPGPNAPMNWIGANLRDLLPPTELAERASLLPSALRSLVTSSRQGDSDQDDESELESDDGPSEDEHLLSLESAAWVSEDETCRIDASAGCSMGSVGQLEDEFSRLMLGLNFYGNEYSLSPRGGDAILGRDFIDRLQKHKPESLKFDPTWREASFTSTEKGVQKIVYYPTPRSMWERVVLAKRLGLGISIWEIGQGLPAFFDLL